MLWPEDHQRWNFPPPHSTWSKVLIIGAFLVLRRVRLWVIWPSDYGGCAISLIINTYLCHPDEEQHYRPNGSSAGEMHVMTATARVSSWMHCGYFFSLLLLPRWRLQPVASFLCQRRQQQPSNLVRWFFCKSITERAIKYQSIDDDERPLLNFVAVRPQRPNRMTKEQ